MSTLPSSRWSTSLREKILFDERGRFLRLWYLFACALARLGVRGAIEYLLAKLRRPGRATEPVSLSVGRGVRIALRDCHTDLAIFEQVMLLGDLRAGTAGAHAEYIIDAGAHIGCSSSCYALKYPRARILAVEAEASNFRQLCRNVEKIPAIRPLHAAVFHRSGQVIVTNPDDAAWGFRVANPDRDGPSPAPGSLIRAMTIGELIRFSGFPRIDFLKLDIEGAEQEIFEVDSQSWLPLVRVMTVELHDRLQPGCTASFEKAVSNIPHRLVKTLNNIIWINLSVPAPAR